MAFTRTDSWPASAIGVPLYFRITSPALMPGMRRGAVGHRPCATSAPAGELSLNDSAERLIHVLDLDAEPAVLDLAGLHDLLLDLLAPD